MNKQSATPFGHLRAPTQVTGPSSHSQAQQSAPISQANAPSSIMNPTFEHPKVSTMYFIVTTSVLFLVTALIYVFFCALKVASSQPIPSQEAATDWVEHTSADGRR